MLNQYSSWLGAIRLGLQKQFKALFTYNLENDVIQKMSHGEESSVLTEKSEKTIKVIWPGFPLLPIQFPCLFQGLAQVPPDPGSLPWPARQMLGAFPFDHLLPELGIYFKIPSILDDFLCMYVMPLHKCYNFLENRHTVFYIIFSTEVVVHLADSESSTKRLSPSLSQTPSILQGLSQINLWST